MKESLYVVQTHWQYGILQDCEQFVQLSPTQQNLQDKWPLENDDYLHSGPVCAWSTVPLVFFLQFANKALTRKQLEHNDK